MTKDIKDIIKDVVEKIDKTLKISRIFNGDFILTKLYVCELKWAKIGMVVLDSQNRDATIVEIGKDYIVVQKAAPFIWTDLMLTLVREIYFDFGTPRMTNNEWLQKSNRTSLKTPFVWLVEPMSESFKIGGGIARESDLRLYFLDDNETESTTEGFHDNVVKYLRAWLDGFLLRIDKDSSFAQFDFYTTRVLTRFGSETPNGFEANIIDANLSAIELRFTLPIRKGANCLC